MSNTQQNEHKFVNSLGCAYLISVASAWNAEFITYPLDLTKTRMQIQGEMSNKTNKKEPYRGMLKTAFGIAREEGIFKLWQGLYAILWRHFIYSGCRMVFYKGIKDNFFESSSRAGYFPVWQSAICGVSAGALAQFIASPTDLIKVQLQMEGRRKLMGLPPRVSGFNDALIQTVRKGGFRGLWKGAIPNVYRAALVNLGDLSTYDVAKRFILHNTTLQDNHFVRFLASVAAGFVAAALATPADVIKTRVMNQPISETGQGLLYKNSVDCLQQTIRNEGPGALYKGFLPIWLRLAPWALTFWLSYEEILYLAGADQF